MMDLLAGCQSSPVRPHPGPRVPRRESPAAADGPVAGMLVGDRCRLAERVGRGARWAASGGPATRCSTAPRREAAHRARAGLAEARLAARVRHPNVAAMHDFIQPGWLHLSMATASTSDRASITSADPRRRPGHAAAPREREDEASASNGFHRPCCGRIGSGSDRRVSTLRFGPWRSCGRPCARRP
jgi:hypothetical protein